MKIMKRVVVLLVLLFVFLSTLQITSAVDTAIIDIVHTNDIHGRSAYQDGKVVGFSKMKSWIDEKQADLVLDAGDTFHGQAFATLEQGQGIAEIMKEVHYDAMTPGNHDWNYGKERLKELGQLSNTPILAANVSENGNSFFNEKGYIIKEVEGVKIGVFGVFDQDIKNDTAPRNVIGIDISNDVKKANELALSLRNAGCDIVVALSHQAYIKEFVEATRGIDVLVAGHEHSVLDERYKDSNGQEVMVVETGAMFSNVGLLSIVYDKNKKEIISMKEELLSATQASHLSSYQPIDSIVEGIDQRQREKLLQKVGSISFDLDGRWEQLRIEETSLGRVVAHSYLAETQADVAFENAGGIRLGRKMNKGNILFKDIIDTAPYGNYIVTKQVNGLALKSIVEASITIGMDNLKSYNEYLATGDDKVRWPDDNGSYLQFAGINVVYDETRPKGNRIVSFKVNNQDLILDKTYTVATNNYISLGKTYPELSQVPEIHQYAACDEALTHFFEKGEKYIENVTKIPSLTKTQIVVKPDPNPEEKDSFGKESSYHIPQTNDDSQIAQFIILFSISIGIFTTLTIYKKRNKEIIS